MSKAKVYLIGARIYLYNVFVTPGHANKVCLAKCSNTTSTSTMTSQDILKLLRQVVSTQIELKCTLQLLSNKMEENQHELKQGLGEMWQQLNSANGDHLDDDGGGGVGGHEKMDFWSDEETEMRFNLDSEPISMPEEAALGDQHDQHEHACDQCGKAYSSAKTLARHQKTAHSAQDKRHQCDQCDKHYGRKDVLLKHIRKFHANASE